MDPKSKHLAERLMKKSFEDLSARDRRVLQHIAERRPVSRDPTQHQDSFGARIADKVASFGGSWSFILIFACILACWVIVNGFLISQPPDPFPFIFLNLVLSMVAAFQAPIIMMSQNRQAQKDREAAANDYEVNLKSEIEIMRLHEKIDEMRLEMLEGRFKQIEGRLDQIEANATPVTGPKTQI